MISMKFWAAVRSLPGMLMVLVVTCCLGNAAPLIYCQSGTYELKPPGGGKEVCPLCPDGTFMPHHNHRNKECYNCTVIRNAQLERLITTCNETQDAIIECISGYYRRQKTECLKCSKCEHPHYQIEPCQKHEDALCCLGENYDRDPNSKGVLLCRERAWLCRLGHYYDTHSSLCKSCPDGTFMHQDYHSMTKCWDCQNPLGHLHSVVLQPCNSTHPPVLGCKAGYFINSTMGYKNEDIGCSPCTDCNTTDQKYEGRECGQFQDAVCCPEANMTVVETDDGPNCQRDIVVTSSTPNVEVCGLGQYLVQNPSDGSSRCLPCKPGIEMKIDELDHMNRASQSQKDLSTDGEDPDNPNSGETKTLDDIGGHSTKNGQANTKLIASLTVSVALNIICLVVIIVLCKKSNNENRLVSECPPACSHRCCWSQNPTQIGGSGRDIIMSERDASERLLNEGTTDETALNEENPPADMNATGTTVTEESIRPSKHSLPGTAERREDNSDLTWSINKLEMPEAYGSERMSHGKKQYKNNSPLDQRITEQHGNNTKSLCQENMPLILIKCNDKLNHKMNEKGESREGTADEAAFIEMEDETELSEETVVENDILPSKSIRTRAKCNDVQSLNRTTADNRRSNVDRQLDNKSEMKRKQNEANRRLVPEGEDEFHVDEDIMSSITMQAVIK